MCRGCPGRAGSCRCRSTAGAGSRSGTWSLVPLTGLTGVTVICGVMFSDQLSRIAGRSSGLLLMICSVQVPLAFDPIKVGELAGGLIASR